MKEICEESPAKIRRFLEVRSLKSHRADDGVPRGCETIITILKITICILHARVGRFTSFNDVQRISNLANANHFGRI